MKYKKLEPPCDKCLGCMRLENPQFVKDENCKYRANSIKEIKEMLGVQEEIWKTK